MLYSMLSNAYLKARAYILPGADGLGAESEERNCDSPHLPDSTSTKSIASQDALTVAETGVNTDVVAIYKALGGGWTS